MKYGCLGLSMADCILTDDGLSKIETWKIMRLIPRFRAEAEPSHTSFRRIYALYVNDFASPDA